MRKPDATTRIAGMDLPDSILRTSRAKRCVIYTRQSRLSSSAVSSCETQRGICADFVAGQAWWLLPESFDDMGESSESLDRPALQRMLNRIELGKVGRVVVYSIDRLTRKLFDLHKLLEMFDRFGVELAVVTDPNFGESAAHRLTTNIIAAASEFQLEMTRERMSDSRAALKGKGRRVASRVPFGYRTDVATKQLVVHEAEASIVRQMFDLAASGSRPQEIADRFNLERVIGPGARTANWTARQVLKMLSNPIYAGSIHGGQRTLPGLHEAIITPAEFEQIRQAIASRRSRAPGRTNAAIDWPLRGLLICGSCGRAMSPSISGYKNLGYRYYRCRSRAFGRPPCEDVGISAFEIEEFVRKTLSNETECPAELSIATPAQQFAAAWSRLDKQQQVKALKLVLKEVRFDPNGGSITLLIHSDAGERLKLA